MIPPKGFKNELYPLQHRLEYSLGLSIQAPTQNTAIMTLVRHTNDIIAGTPASIIVNPHNTGYMKDAGPAVCKMSIIDKLTMSLKFNMTENCAEGVDGISTLHFLWRPIFFSFNEKLAAADDDTGTTVESILALTSDATFEDVVPLTTNKLSVIGTSEKPQPVSTVNIAEVFGDYNMTTDTTMEDQVWNEDLFQEALKRYTNKGALRSMIGSTRHVTLTTARPFKNFYIDKFVPRAIRRVMPYTFMAIQVHVPKISGVSQAYYATTVSSVAHLGVKMICQYDEWNADHFQDMAGTAP